ncbi:CAF17-like 4Fe-4S cluster assembly/insertion protein YgfZ [Aurantivibrio plasticivorans]
MTEKHSKIGILTMSYNQWQTFIIENPAETTNAKQRIVDLSKHYTVLSITGPDAAKFLQGQVTCDINNVTTTQSQLGARCNNKGRVEFTFRILRSPNHNDRFLLLIPAEFADTAVQTLNKYIVFSKAELVEESDIVFGTLQFDDQAKTDPAFFPNEVDQTVENKGAIISKHSENQWLVIAPIESAKAIWGKLVNISSSTDLNGWRLATIKSGRPEVLPGAEDEFIPQMLNYDLLSGGVSFTKGCYLGQEIVARMQYRGKMKRHLQRLSGQSEVLPTPGQPLFLQSSTKTIGNIVVAATTNSNALPHSVDFEALAVLTDEAVEENCINLTGDSPTNLQLVPLPYAIPY